MVLRDALNTKQAVSETFPQANIYSAEIKIRIKDELCAGVRVGLIVGNTSTAAEQEWHTHTDSVYDRLTIRQRHLFTCSSDVCRQSS